MKQKSLDLSSLKTMLRRVGTPLYRYRMLLFFLALAVVYGYTLVQINTLSRAEPTADQVDVPAKTKSLKVDPDVLQHIQQLQDNSVSVQSLFDQARNNPFHE